MIFEGIVKGDQYYLKLLAQNVYYIIPTVNVDGAALIESTYRENGKKIWKRGNMRVEVEYSGNCTEVNAGVDLNRNYGFKWAEGEVDDGECQGREAYPGTEAFSESETRAVRDFLISKVNNIKFVFNFHSAGKFMITPINADFPNTLSQNFPEINDIFKEFTKEVKFPYETDIGPASETVGVTVGGSAGDWIVNELHIPAVEPEIGTFDDVEDWFPKSDKIGFQLAHDQLNMLNYAAEKIGNQITLEAVGYKVVAEAAEGKRGRATLVLKVHNHGLSGQIYGDFQIRIANKNFHVLKDQNGRQNPKEELFNKERFHNLPLNIYKGKASNKPGEGPLHPNSVKDIVTNLYFINGLKSRSETVLNIECETGDQHILAEDGTFETTIEYDQFSTSVHSKQVSLSFNKIL